MRAACFAPSFLQKRGVLNGGWHQVGNFHYHEKFSLLLDTTVHFAGHKDHIIVLNFLTLRFA